MAASNVVDSLRQLFNRGDYESVVQRAETTIKKRKSGIRSEAGQKNLEILQAINICALIRLGRNAEAAKNFAELKSTDNENIAHFISITAPYLAWTGSGDISEALKAVKNLERKNAQKIEAQLLYRLGRYEEASQVYVMLLKDAQDTLAEKKKPAATSRWTLRASATKNVPVTAAELETLNQTITELSTNLMATLVLSGKCTEAMSKKSGVASTYEVEYNGACASIGTGDLGLADILLEKAETLLEADIEEEEPADEEMAPIKVQRAYLKQKSGNVKEAKETYDAIVNNKKADAGCLAVAANNLAVSLGQLAFDKEVQEYEKERSNNKNLVEEINDANYEVKSGDSKKPENNKSEKDKYMALSEGLKKMRATSGTKVENKLTKEQRRAMARNRSILLVQMGRLDGCKQELERLKMNYPGDPINPLIEATLLAKKKNLQAAEEILGNSSNTEIIQLARIQLAEDAGDYERTAQLLLEFYGDTPAGVATAASIYEKNLESKEKAVEILRDYKGTEKKEEVKKEVAELLGRMGKYEEAAQIWEELLRTGYNSTVVLAELIVATSYFDTDKAKELAEKLPATNWSANASEDKDSNSDIEMMSGEELEKLAPPKVRRNLNSATISAGLSQLKIDDGGNNNTGKAKKGSEKKNNKKKKIRLPKNYDPNGAPPDPERWIPKTQRAAYKKKHKRKEGGNQVNFRGSQGADKKAADEQAIKNKERAAAKAKAEAEAATMAPVSNRPKGTKAKKKKRK